jgi:predicted nucleic acid-binding protein
MIAAIALSRGLPVHTSNPDDFHGMDGLTVIAVPTPA